MPSLGPRLPLAFRLWLSPACLSASGRRMGWSAPGLLSSGIHSILCSVSGPGCASELFAGKFSLSLSFFSFSLTISQFGLLYHVSSLRLSSMHSNPVVTPKQAAHASRFIPSSLLADASIWATSLPGVVLGCMICVCGVFFSLPVMLPFEIPKLPTDPPVRGFPGVWKLLLHNSLPRTGLHP